jgi:CHASE2 domain-containing sensor protein
VGGGAAGALLAGLAARERDQREFLVAGLCVAGLAGSLGCSLAGAVGVLAMLLGALGAGAPVWALAHARR